MLTPRENFIKFFKNEPTEWVPTSLDYKQFAPEEIIENVARGFVAQQEPFPKEKNGGRGYFGIDWIYEPLAGGSMEVAPLWEEVDEEMEAAIEWPNLDEIDWEGIKARNAEFLNTDRMIRTTIFTGFYERLISFVGFENAAMALLDEDCEEVVRRIFDRLADTYIDFIKRMHHHFNVELFELHDDWGTQQSTMFSFDTHRDLIIPYVRKVVDAAHEEGCFIEMHSCGHVDSLMPNFIEAHLDTWRGQANATDKPGLVAKYGDQFKFGAEIRPAPNATQEDILALIADFKKNYTGKNIWIALSVLMDPEMAKFILAELAK